MTQQTVSDLEKLADVSHVETSQNVANLVLSMSKAIKNICIVIMVILLVISVVIISNTVRLTVFNRRKEINIMKYIGATDFFVRAPFVMEGVWIGLIGAALPLWLIYSLYNTALTYIAERFNMLSQLLNFLSVEEIFHVLTPVSLGVGIGIGFLGSVSTVRKHLHV